MPPLKLTAFDTRSDTQASPTEGFRLSLRKMSGQKSIVRAAVRVYRKYMKMLLLAIGLSGALALAQEKTIEVPKEKAETSTPQTKDPQQSRNEQTTQIATNTAKGTAPISYK